MAYPNKSRASKKTSEFRDKALEIRRVTRVVAGGKRFSFRATVVVGNMRGKVGIGVAKGLDVASAVQKARKKAEKNAFSIPLIDDNRTIPYDVIGKYNASVVKLKPAKKGHGLIAGGSCRTVLELSGIKDISAKILSRSTNKLANAKAAITALQMLTASKKSVMSSLETEDFNSEDAQIGED